MLAHIFPFLALRATMMTSLMMAMVPSRPEIMVSS
jgi:hypothetical protein